MDIMSRLALYFGCGARAGHHLRGTDLIMTDAPPHFPWDGHHLDGGLLQNGKHDDIYDGRVFWTCGGRHEFWFAFFWWDNSIDKRGASNSGFYVRGFELVIRTPAAARIAAIEAFRYACEQFPDIVKRQRQPLVLQDVGYDQEV